MNNHPYAGGPPALPMFSQQRRDHYSYHPAPQSPIPPYNNYTPYYNAPPPRWHQQPYYPHQMPQYMPPQQYAQRSPMHAPPMTPVRQQNPLPTPPQSTQSPRPIPPYIHQQPPAASSSPVPAQGHTTAATAHAPASAQAPVPATVPKIEERVETPPPPPSRRESSAQNPLALPPEYKQPYWPDVSPTFSSSLFRMLT